MLKEINNIQFNSRFYGYKQVDSYLYKGSAPTIRQLVELNKKGVNQVFDFRHDSMRGLKFIEVFMCKLLGIKYNRRKFSFLNEKAPTLKDFEDVAASIKENGKNGGKTLIHCNSGHHRTGLMVEFYNLTRGETLEDCKKMYPRTYFQRVKVILRDLIIKDDYFDRHKKNVDTLNPIKYFTSRFNNRVVDKTKQAYENFKAMLIG